MLSCLPYPACSWPARLRIGRMLCSAATNHRHAFQLRLICFQENTAIPPSWFDHYWLLNEASVASGIHPAHIIAAIAEGKVEAVYDTRVWIDTESLRAWAYVSSPLRTSKAHGLLIKTEREIRLLLELFEALDMVKAYADKINFELPADWIGQVIAEIHYRERKQRLAIHESAEALGWADVDDERYEALLDEFEML